MTLHPPQMQGNPGPQADVAQITCLKAAVARQRRLTGSQDELTLFVQHSQSRCRRCRSCVTGTELPLLAGAPGGPPGR